MALHQQLIHRFGGLAGVRDEGLLRSAVLRAEQRVHYDPHASVATVASVLAWGLIRNHAFLDGNKRVALASLVVFLDLNGFDLATSEEDEVRMVLRAAASEITEEE